LKKLEIGPNIYVIKTALGLAALDMANMLYRLGEVKAASGLVARSRNPIIA
jgi:hypothetical protein